ncbi:MAG: hypothetical protein ACE5LU_22645 [Anaerolineae bacterium]
MTTETVKRCDCGKPATQPVKVSTIWQRPGVPHVDGKIVTIYVCPGCYETEGWDETDLAGTPWELTLRDGA